MRKCFVAFLILAFLTAGTVQAAAYSSGAVKTLVSRTLTKVCSAANDNRCLRLVSGASDVLDKTLTAASFFGKTNWLTLALSVLVPVVGDYAFELGKKIRVSLTKSNDEVIVTQVEKSVDTSSVPVVSYDNSFSNLQVMRGPVYERNTVKDRKHTDDLLYSAYSPVVSGYNGSSPNVMLFSSLKTAIRRLPGVSFPQQNGTFSYDGKTYAYSLPYFYHYSFASDGQIELTRYEPINLTDWHFVDSQWVAWYGAPSQAYVSWEFQYYLIPVSIKDDNGTTLAYIQFLPSTGSDFSCDYAYFISGSVCFTDMFTEDVGDSDNINSYYKSESSVITTTPNIPFDEWLDTLTETEKQQLASTDLLSDFVDQLWKDTAAQPDYTGEPYVQGKITPDLIEQVSPAPPTIGDMLEPINDTVTPGSGVQPGTTLTPDTGTGSLTDPSTGTDTGSEPIGGIISPTVPGTGIGTVGDQNINIDVNLDLGDYPAVNQPALEEPPTAANILDPIFNLFPSLQNYQVPERNVSCPMISIELWGEEYSTDLHCQIIEENRSVISAMMILFFTVSALIVVLGA